MKFKFLFRLLLLIALVLVLHDVFARAGGGHGGGSHGSSGYGGGRSYGGYGYYGKQSNGFEAGGALYIFLIVTSLILIGVAVVVIPTLLEFKSKISKKILTRAAHKDTLWEEQKLIKHANATFHKIQHAWENRNIDLVKKIISPELYDSYKRMLDEMKIREEKNILDKIYISETRIIGCQDFVDDSKDRYVAHIKGSILDYVIHEPSKSIILNHDKSIEIFFDTYHFVRNNNTWILEDIVNSPNDLDIFKIKNHIEE